MAPERPETEVGLPNEAGLLCVPGPDGRCAVCADEGLPGRVVALRPDGMALVALPDGEREVALDLVDAVAIGSWLLVHVGVAIATLPADWEEAAT